jgi:5-methylcytosine-specific restriction endonuclease McrA
MIDCSLLGSRGGLMVRKPPPFKECKTCGTRVENDGTAAWKTGYCRPHWLEYNRAKGRKYYRKNRERELERNREYRKRNDDAIRTYRKRKHQEEMAKPKEERYATQYRRRNRDKILARGREYDRRRHKRNPDRYKYYRDKRRARLAGAEGSFTIREWRAVLNMFGGVCAYCPNEGSTRDHLIPLARGGSNWIENIVPCCSSCNSRKLAKTLTEFLEEIGEAIDGDRKAVLLNMEKVAAKKSGAERKPYAKVPESSLIEAARAVMAKFGKVTGELLGEHTPYNASTYYRRFGMKKLREIL